MTFQFYPLRFEFAAVQPIFFPPGKASNTLRGGMGLVFRSLACTPECRKSGDATSCEIRATCPYARIFEPVSGGQGPSGLADSPRPFVFRARHLDGCVIQAGEIFSFDLNVFLIEDAVRANLIGTFATLAREGLGPKRGRAELRNVLRLAAGGLPEQAIHISSPNEEGTVEPVTLSLKPAISAPERVRITFHTPTELKHNHRIAERPEFPILFGRIRDRVSTLRSLYGAGPVKIDYRAIAARASLIKMTHCQLERQEIERRSSRTGQSHSIGGFTGAAEYEGDLAEFIPWLEAAHYTGVGRHAVWGKGEISVEAVAQGLAHGASSPR